jgi:acetyltransferase
VNVVGVDRIRRIAGVIAQMARDSGRTIVSYQTSPLGALDEEIIRTMHGAGVPVLMGIQNAISVLRYLLQRRDFFREAAREAPADATPQRAAAPLPQDFLAARQALVAASVPVAEAALASSAQEAVSLWRKFAQPVALKAEAPGLLHKSDLGCVVLNCATESDVVAAYDEVVRNARKAGFAPAGALVQPMAAGIAECFAGIIDDPLYGPAIVFGLGGIFVELMRETVTEMAPLTKNGALHMIKSVKGAQILAGARGRAAGDIEALADCLVNLSRFAVVNAGRFRALDLNPIIVRPQGEGVLAVDIAIDPIVA